MHHSLVIHSQGLDIWRHTPGGLEHESRITTDEAQTKLQHWLTVARRRITLIADLAEERHAVERLPHTSRADRLQLIERKLAQRFPDAGFTRATPLPSGAEDGLNVLLSAIPRSSSITLWLDVLTEASVKGQTNAPHLTSVPFLIERWYCRQRELPPQCLLLTLGAGGMRQILFRQRRLAFSRVITAKTATLAENLPVYRDELTQTLAWLSSQRLIEGSPPILVLATEADFSLLRELAPSSSSVMDFIDIARCSGGGANALSLALRETRQGGAPGHYNCHALRRARRLTTARYAAWAATLAILTAGVATATAGFIDIDHLRQETTQLNTERQKLQNELEKLNAEATSEPGADLPDDWFNEVERLIHDPRIAPVDILQAVASLLDKAPWARLESLTWNASDGAQSTDIELEISLDGNEPLQAAADKLVSLWPHDSPMKVHIDSDMARLRLDTTFSLPTAP